MAHLPEAHWRTRHHALMVVAGVQLLLLAIFGAVTGAHPASLAGVVGGVAACCLLSVSGWPDRSVRTVLGTVALLGCSGMVAWLVGGVHGPLHLLASLVLLALYADWTPLGLGVGVAVVAAAGAALAPGEELEVILAPSTSSAVAFVAYAVLLAGGLTAARTLTEREGHQRDLVVHSTAEGIYAVDLAGVITFANAVAGRLLGRSIDELVGGEEHRLAGHSDSEGKAHTRMRCPACRLIRDGAEVHVTGQRFRRADGRAFPVEYMSSKPQDGSDLRIVTFRDSSDGARPGSAVTHDPLTALPNRARLLEYARHALSRLDRYSQTVAILYVDLDRFKLANDSLGHEAGDRILVETAERLQGVLRVHDVVARLAGDEFVVLCTDLTDEQHVFRIAHRILEALQTSYRVGGTEAALSASIGMAWTTDASCDPERLIADADTAMQQAKEDGGGRLQVFDQGNGTKVINRLRMETDLRKALEGNQLVLHYQPKVSFTTGRFVGLEALVRWHHPRDGMISPAGFIPLAEESGLIVPMGAWILEEACRTVQEWRRTLPGAASLLLAVNLSGRQLSDPGLVDTVRRVLRETGTPPRLLCLEITESVVMRKVDQTVRVLQELKALGVKLAVDDFGTGYSSLAYLSRFPVDVLKVDRSFVNGLGEDKQSDSICGAVISLAQALGLSTVAEGVEEESQITVLRALGCNIAQGFYFARPTASHLVPKLLEQGSGWAPPEGSAPAEKPRKPLSGELMAELDFLNGDAPLMISRPNEDRSTGDARAGEQAASATVPPAPASSRPSGGAEAEGFEPSRGVKTPTSLAVTRHRPD